VNEQQVVVSAMRQVGLIVAEHLELRMLDADEVISRLIAVSETQEVVDAMNRLERGYGLRVMK
jgi:hypothetical protein